VAALALVLLVILLYLLGQRREEPTLAVICESRDQGVALRDTSILSRTEYLVTGEVIVTGPADGIKDVLEDLASGKSRQVQVSLDAIRECQIGDLGQLARSGDLDSRTFPFPPEARGKLAMNLYQFGDEFSVGQVVAAIEELGRERHVFADANYLTSLLGPYQCGHPYEPVGSPYEPVGSPAGDSAVAGQGLFWGQWAFEHIGAGAVFTESFEAASLVPDGTGVRVGVFDTSPFPMKLGEVAKDETGIIHTMAVSRSGMTQMTTTVMWVTPHLTLTVGHPDMPVLTPTNAISINVNDHGLFVAGLVHAVAPESDIQLIRVLDKYGCGDLYTFNEALYRFIDQLDGDQAPDHAVINLSLGVRKPTSREEDEAEESSGDPVEQRTTSMAGTPGEEVERLLDDTVESLRAAVTLADGKGIVVVAAAGNDSFSSGIPVAPQIPARYPFVIGVEASNAYRERACFSNWGDVSAPGGDARFGGTGNGSCNVEGDQGQGGNAPDESRSVTETLQLENLISLSRSSPTNYVYWRGTSFATPLVSGLAALVLDAGVPGVGPEITRRVFDAIRCGAPMGDGVINAPATMLRCLP